MRNPMVLLVPLACASCASSSTAASTFPSPPASSSPGVTPTPADPATVARFFQALGDGKRGVAATLLAEHPDLAEASSAKGTSAFVAALFQTDGETFVAPQRNEAVAAVLARHPRLDPLEAAAAGNVATVEGALARDPGYVRRVHALGWTALHFAAFAGQAAIAGRLLGQGADIDARARNRFANTPLQVALLSGQSDMVRLLITHHADVNVRQGEGFTALHEAAQNGDAASVRLLLEAGADPSVRGGDKHETALDHAVASHHEEVAALLRATTSPGAISSP